VVLSDVPEQGLAGQPRAEPRARPCRPAARPDSGAKGRTPQRRRMVRTARTPQHTACSGSHLHAGSACPGACDQSSHRRNGPSPSRTLTLTDIGEELRSGLRSGLRELLSAIRHNDLVVPECTGCVGHGQGMFVPRRRVDQSPTKTGTTVRGHITGKVLKDDVNRTMRSRTTSTTSSCPRTRCSWGTSWRRGA